MKSIRTAGTCVASAVMATAMLSATASGQFVEQEVQMPQIGPLDGGATQVETVDISPNDVPVLGFRFEGNVSGISGTPSWASDLRLVITAPTGDVYDVGGFENETNPWSFAGADSTSDGFYTDERIGAFPFIDKEGTWTFEFTNDWGPGATMTWNNVVITLLKGTPLPVECPDDDPCPGCMALGDINDDGVIDGLDLLALLGCWGSLQPGCECADINNDGSIDGLDLLALLGNWGPCPVGSDDGSGGVVIESEQCGETTNDGCNMEIPSFGELLTCGDTVCGTAWAEDGTRDTDWYQIEVDSKQRVQWTVHAEFPAQAIIVWSDPGCDQIFVVAAAQGVLPNLPFSVDACLQPGKPYTLFVSPLDFDGIPCDGSGNYNINYTASVKCLDATDCPKGACCFSKEDCQNDWDEIKCIVAGGQYGGDGSVCGEFQCAFGACCMGDGTCHKTSVDDCLDLGGAYRGHGTQCEDMVEIDINCNGVVEDVPICYNCSDGSRNWCNPSDVCDESTDQDPFNGGCNYYPDENPAWEQACCGDVISGTIWSIADEGRDLDWRVLTVEQDSAVTIQIDHGFGDVGLDAVLFIGQVGCPMPVIVSGAVQTGGGLFTLLEAGTYFVVVTTEFVPDGGTDLECGTASSQYQLQINCGPLLTDLCENTCTAGFISHPGYPQNTCSCNEDTCTPPVGSTDIGNPNFCCPNICEFCDEGICDIADCVAAQDVTANINGASVTGDNSNAFGEGALPPGSPSCQWQGLPQNVHNTVWYRFTAPANGAVTIETCGSSTPFQDSVLGLYSGECGSLVEIGCGGDDCPAPDSPPYYSRIIATGLTPGQTYYISLSNNGGWGGSTPGAYVLDITSP